MSLTKIIPITSDGMQSIFFPCGTEERPTGEAGFKNNSLSKKPDPKILNEYIKYFKNLNTTRQEALDLHYSGAKNEDNPTISADKPIETLWIFLNNTSLPQEVIDFCKKNELLTALQLLFNYIEKYFTNLENIDLSCIEDPEIEDFEKVCITLHIKNDPEKILSEEDSFKKELNRDIDREKRQFFVLTYHVG